MEYGLKQSHSGGISFPLIVIFLSGAAFGMTLAALLSTVAHLRVIDFPTALVMILDGLFLILSVIIFVKMVARLNRSNVSSWRIK